MNIQEEPKRDHIAEFLALHKPQHQQDLMVYEVWQDGEITLTKGANLWRQRGLHMLKFPVRAELAMPVDRMPIKYGDNGSIIVATNEEAETAHALVVLYATERLNGHSRTLGEPSAPEVDRAVA